MDLDVFRKLKIDDTDTGGLYVGGYYKTPLTNF